MTSREPNPDNWLETAVVLLIPYLDNQQGCENDLAKVKIPKPDVILNPATGRQRSAERHEARYQTSG